MSYVPSMATERDGCAAAVVGNKLLVVGGRDVEQHTLASAECFDMEAQTWSSLPGMATKRVGCATAAVSNKLLVVGGRDENRNSLDSAECFNMEEQTWCPHEAADFWREITVGSVTGDDPKSLSEA